MTSLVNTETGEIVESLTTDQARRLTDRIRLMGESVADQLDKMAGLIDAARTGSAWLALGYRSWTDYVATEFAGIIPRLDREPRQELVRDLSSRGMSVRSIAPIVGVGKSTVERDLAPVPDGTPQTPAPSTTPSGTEKVGALDGAGLNLEGGEVAPVLGGSVEPEPCGAVSRPPVTGIDGKQYPAPAPRAANRKPLPDVARDAGWDARKLAERIERLGADDRYPQNADQVATAMRSHLIYAIEVYQDLLDRFNNN